MTEPTKRRRVRKSLVFGAAVAAGAIAVLIAYLLGAFEKRQHIEADEICQHVPDRQKVAKVFNSTLHRSSKYDFEGTWRPERDWEFRSTCFAIGDDDKALFSLTAEMSSARPWQQWAKSETPRNDGGKISYFNAGLKGVSNAEVAAIWVPCYAHEKTSKQPWNMTVFALALKPLEASDKEARQTLIDLATSFARQAHKDAECDLPSKLPS
ncbi:hypothetical protein [Streptomyces sp. NBC_00078]|uniref:hypothetical protein n=1 Tax=unclassified Streptomyces TaxID=2593676 RepID=UPI002252D482|nr:hypothetical protein [Streptomyces sp. NBC_00078]MCX5422852.1 hypothetical protein [Streptomyces sp. NBC_00078]